MAGLLPEFQRGANDFRSAEGDEVVAGAVRQALGTSRADGRSPGELRWRQGFGSRIDRFRFMPNTSALAELVRTDVADTFSRWLPSLVFVDATVSRQASDVQRTGRPNVLVITVQWRGRRRRELSSTTVDV